MNLYEKIIAIYPELKPEDFYILGTIVLRNDGEGDYIEQWNHPTFQKPTEAQLSSF